MRWCVLCESKYGTYKIYSFPVLYIQEKSKNYISSQTEAGVLVDVGLYLKNPRHFSGFYVPYLFYSL